MSYDEVMAAVSTGQIQVSESIVRTTSAFTKLGSGIKTVLSSALTTVAIIAALTIAEKALSAFYNNVIMKQENMIKAGEEAKNTISDINSEYENLQQSTNDI